MKNTLGWSLGIMFALSGICAPAHAAPGVAKALIHDASGKEVGSATFKSGSYGKVHVDLSVSGLPAGTHAVHIHEAGKCETPDFKSAGGHFNPGSKHHGHQNPQGWHAGDLPNLVVGKNGKGKAAWTTKDVTLTEDADNSVFHAGGTSLVIHAQADDEMSDPAGNAGARIACGAITH